MRTISTYLIFFFFLTISTITAQEITIYTMPAPKKMDWRSPRKLIKSCFINKIVRSPYGENRHPIGHMVVELRDSTRYEIVGMAPAYNTLPIDKIVKEKYGFGVLFTALEGKLEYKEENLPQVQERLKNGDIAFVNYKLNQEVFDRMWEYLVGYHEKGYDKFYNGNNRPREGTGGGCSAFAVSFLEVGGIEAMLPIEEWKVTVNVPEDLIGGPHCDNKKVKIHKMFFTRKWADSNTTKIPYESISFYEPTKIYNWILERHLSVIELPNVYKATYGKSRGLVVDAKNNALPLEPIWYVNNDTKTKNSVKVE